MKKIPLIVLGVLSLIASRASFMLVNDPEGPNLLIVVVWAAVIFSVSWAAYALARRAFSATIRK